MDTGLRRAARPAGFTLLELMVALTVGGIAITSIYAIGSASTRQFHTQQQVANTQSSLRIALNQVKRDLARAGFLSTPSASAPGQVCAPVSSTIHNPPTMSLAGISRFTNDIGINTASNNNGNVDPTGNNVANGASVDEIVLMANYETANEYSGVRLTNSSEIAISGTWHAFTQDFTDWYNPSGDPFEPTAFARAFTAGRLIRIRTTTGVSHFAQVAANGLTDPTPGPPATDALVRFAPAIPGGCQATVTGGWVAPVSTIRYVVQNAAGGTLNDQRNVATPGGAIAASAANPNAQLWRVEVLPTDTVTPLDAANLPARVVADYVVGFNVSFTMSTQGNPNLADIYNVGVTTNTPATVNANPERVRAVTVDLAVRTPDQDRFMQFSQTNCANLRCFQVNTAPGAARVRRMRAEVFLPNLATEGY
jgi:prepilin-type N-terminal cleavage/methylation domain-containing protein